MAHTKKESLSFEHITLRMELVTEKLIMFEVTFLGFVHIDDFEDEVILFSDFEKYAASWFDEFDHEFVLQFGELSEQEEKVSGFMLIPFWEDYYLHIEIASHEFED